MALCFILSIMVDKLITRNVLSTETARTGLLAADVLLNAHIGGVQ